MDCVTEYLIFRLMTCMARWFSVGTAVRASVMSPFLQWFCPGFCDSDQFCQASSMSNQNQNNTKTCQSMLCMFRFIFVGLLYNANNCNKHIMLLLTLFYLYIWHVIIRTTVDLSVFLRDIQPTCSDWLLVKYSYKNSDFCYYQTFKLQDNLNAAQLCFNYCTFCKLVCDS